MADKIETIIAEFRATLREPPTPLNGYHLKTWENFESAIHALAQGEPGEAPDGRLHADGYFTWNTGKPPNYRADLKLPCDFYLSPAASAPAAEREPPSNTTMKRDEWGALSPEAQQVMRDVVRARTLRAAQGATSIRDVSLGQAEAPTASNAGERDEKLLRKLLAIRVAGAALYGDDGELQDNSVHPCIDFKRDSAEEIERKLLERGTANAWKSIGKYAALAQVPEQVARDRFEQAMKQTWQMIDPLRPPVAGSYALGEHNGIAAALKTLRENYERAARTSGEKSK